MVSVQHIWGTCDHVAVKVIGVFQCICLKLAITLKTAVDRAKATVTPKLDWVRLIPVHCGSSRNDSWAETWYCGINWGGNWLGNGSVDHRRGTLKLQEPQLVPKSCRMSNGWSRSRHEPTPEHPVRPMVDYGSLRFITELPGNVLQHPGSSRQSPDNAAVQPGTATDRPHDTKESFLDAAEACCCRCCFVSSSIFDMSMACYVCNSSTESCSFINSRCFIVLGSNTF